MIEEKNKLSDQPLLIQKKKKIPSLRPSQVVNKKRLLYDFEGKWFESFGKPEHHAKWFITGPSFSGKSSFIYSLCDYLCDFSKLDYNSYEEGDSATTATKITNHGLLQREDKFRLIPRVPIEDFKEHLLRKRQAKIAVIDSIQHARMNIKQYKDWVDTFCNPRRGKMMIFISHWKKDDLTLFVKHDCDIKIEIIGFVAYVKSRYNEGPVKPFLIWEEGAKEHWGKKYKQVITGKYWPGEKG